MKKIIKWITDNLSWLVVTWVGLLCALFIIFGTKTEEGFIAITKDGTPVITDDTKDFIAEAQIKYGEYAKAIMNIDGEEVEIDAPTVESVDGVKMSDDTYTGQGLYAPTGTIAEFKDFTIGKCFNVDGAYGAQCWDLGALFWSNYAGRSLNTCGTGAAKGTIGDGCWQKNAGNEFTMIWDKAKIQAGDWVVFTNGKFGHIGMALGEYNNGYVTLLGQNQGGSACSGGGSATNIINISLANFGGAFRPNTYIKPTPTPTPTPTPVPVVKSCDQWQVSKGDTMGKIMKNCEGTIDWSRMNDYADTWYSTVVKPGQSVYQGWQSPSGVGLYNGDIIEKR